MKRQKPSRAHFRKFLKKKTKTTASYQDLMATFMKLRNSSASSRIPENQQNESIVSENLNEESSASQGKENESSLLHFAQSVTNEGYDVVEQLHSYTEVIQFF